MKKVAMIMDLQFGSTGKGLIAGTVAHGWEPDTVVTAWGPNAGHTYVHGDGRKHITRMLATGAIAPSVQDILIGPGSVLDVECLAAEIRAAGSLLKGKTLTIHPNTPVLEEKHQLAERELVRIGSTMKGTAAAAIDKIMRKPDAVVGGIHASRFLDLVNACDEAGLRAHTSSAIYDSVVDDSRKMLVEGAQGFSLGIHTHFYPHTTSRDISTAQVLADCRLPIPDHDNLSVVGVARTFPIRVANRRDEKGEMIGYSGNYYHDQCEIEWSDINRLPELTTVTKLQRRLFTFSYQQLRDACRIIRPKWLALTFCDYLKDDEAVKEHISTVDKYLDEAAILMASFGPSQTDVREVDADNGVAGDINWAVL